MKKGDFVKDDRGYITQLTSDPEDGVVYTSKAGGAPRITDHLEVVEPPFVAGDTVAADDEYWKVEGVTAEVGQFQFRISNPQRCIVQLSLEPVFFGWELITFRELDRGDIFLAGIVGRDIATYISPKGLPLDEVTLDGTVRRGDWYMPEPQIEVRGKTYMKGDYIWRKT